MRCVRITFHFHLLNHGLIFRLLFFFYFVKGWTTWLERVLQGTLHGPAERDFSYIIGRKGLTEALEQFKDRPKYQRLVIPFEVSEGSRFRFFGFIPRMTLYEHIMTRMP